MTSGAGTCVTHAAYSEQRLLIHRAYSGGGDREGAFGRGRGEDGNTLVAAIDDNSDVLDLITISLEQSPYQVIGCTGRHWRLPIVPRFSRAITLDYGCLQKSVARRNFCQLKSNPDTVSLFCFTVLEDRSAGAMFLGADDYLVKQVSVTCPRL